MPTELSRYSLFEQNKKLYQNIPDLSQTLDWSCTLGDRFVVCGADFIGKGSFSIVRKAFDKQTQKYVALKTYLEKSHRVLKKFKNQVRILQELNEEDIPRGTNSEDPFIGYKKKTTGLSLNLANVHNQYHVRAGAERLAALSPLSSANLKMELGSSSFFLHDGKCESTGDILRQSSFEDRSSPKTNRPSLRNFHVERFKRNLIQDIPEPPMPMHCFVKMIEYSRDADGSPGPSEIDGGYCWIVLEYGDFTLEDFLIDRKKQNRPLILPELQGIIRSLVGILYSLHYRHIVHLDFKPENIMMIDGHWKLIDLEGATFTKSQFDSQQHVISFTPVYCAPEFAAGVARIKRKDLNAEATYYRNRRKKKTRNRRNTLLKCPCFKQGTRITPSEDRNKEDFLKPLTITRLMDIWALGLLSTELLLLKPMLTESFYKFYQRGSLLPYFDWLSNSDINFSVYDYLSPEIIESTNPYLLDLIHNCLLRKSTSKRWSIPEIVNHPFLARNCLSVASDKYALYENKMPSNSKIENHWLNHYLSENLELFKSNEYRDGYEAALERQQVQLAVASAYYEEGQEDTNVKSVLDRPIQVNTKPYSSNPTPRDNHTRLTIRDNYEINVKPPSTLPSRRLKDISKSKPKISLFRALNPQVHSASSSAIASSVEEDRQRRGMGSLKLNINTEVGKNVE